MVNVFFGFIVLIIFVFGLAIGSFINALEYRIDTKLSIVKGRSICPQCKKQLAWYENIPVFSFIFLRGKCSQCKKPISWQYPIVELLTGAAFVAMAMRVGWVPGLRPGMTTTGVIGLICLSFIAFCLILVALHDQKTSYVLSGYIYAAIIATLIYLAVTYTGAWGIRELGIYLLPNVLASLAAMIPFAVLYLVSKGAWMGAGDIEIAALLGLFLGWPNFLAALYFAFIVGSIWGIAKVYIFKNANLKSEMPFAPFLIGGIFFAFLFAEQLSALYVRIFLG